MKQFLMGAAAALAMLGAAQAADLPSTQEPAFTPPPEASPLFNWTGLYGGVNVGYSFGDTTPNTLGLPNPNGFFGGAQIGYNYQFNQFVAGLEADWQIGSIKEGTVEIDNFGTVRGRFGYAIDRFMPYVTGGYAFANTSILGNDGMHNGWVLGGGVEYAWTDHFTTKLEGLYTDYSGRNTPGGNAGLETFTVRTGVNYKF
jgi:outer membrane immunogenic protein